ncbi:MAG TPA: M28 family peptidase [Candidatus Eisenbacteria bacterium]|nr:M28 family peptidase [Candidatus Eisenbacteria bacterium]
MTWVERQVSFGPRAPGTYGHDACFAFLDSTMRAYAPIVEADTFHYYVSRLGKEVALFNLRARFVPEAEHRIVLAAHWDTRPWADRETDPAKRKKAILGANDGASGVAVLLELARLMHEQDPKVGVDIAFFDGEDLGTEEDQDGWFRGSKQYVARYSGEPKPLFVVVVDMVGKKDLALHWEGNSYEQAGNVVDLVWSVANAVGARSFRSDVKHRVFDDHIPFLQAGIPAIVLIDFDFPQWHTIADDLKAVDPESLGDVGRVLHSLVSDPTYLSD